MTELPVTSQEVTATFRKRSWGPQSHPDECSQTRTRCKSRGDEGRSRTPPYNTELIPSLSDPQMHFSLEGARGGNTA